MLKISGSYSPPPPDGFVSPVLWGKEDVARKRFAAAGVADERISCTRAIYTFAFDGPPREFLNIFRGWYGPTMNAYEAAARDGREGALDAELLALFEAQNASGDKGRTEIPAAYLRVEVGV